MKIYTIRHGYTNMNKQHLYNGQIDEDINEEGIKGAKEAREQLKDMNFDVIYCSPMMRAKHTCEIININNVPVIYDDRLKERTLGFYDGKNLKEEGISESAFYDYFYKNNTENFEELPALFKRVHTLLDEIKQKEYNNILIVAHGGILRAIHYYFNEIPKNGDLSNFKPANCEILEYDIK
ncbi:MAG: histidine phosphatase family protein [Clostridia bacterium]|nr:histidine phosphatase family protein [Clostridia bacterium]